MFALFFLHFVPFFSDWLNFVAQELKPKEKIYLVNKLHASCRLSHSAHIKTLRKTITITKRCRINEVFLDGPVLLCDVNSLTTYTCGFALQSWLKILRIKKNNIFLYMLEDDCNWKKNTDYFEGILCPILNNTKRAKMEK